MLGDDSAGPAVWDVDAREPSVLTARPADSIVNLSFLLSPAGGGDTVSLALRFVEKS